MKEEPGRNAQRSQVDPEAEIARLRNELFSAREALIGMASGDFKDLFHGLNRCKSHKEASDWLRSSVEEAVKRVNPRPAQEMGDLPHNGPRAYCPMCGGSSEGIFQIQGFAHPEGLRRHLEGLYNVRHCVVMKAALALACEAAEDAAARPLTIRLIEAPRKRGAAQPKR